MTAHATMKPQAGSSAPKPPPESISGRCVCGETITVVARRIIHTPPCSCGRSAAEGLSLGPDWATIDQLLTTQRREHRETNNVVYFATNGHQIKIGTTKRLQTRIRELPGIVRVLGTIAGGLTREREMHQRFAHLRVEGEWFLPGEDLLEFIRDDCDAPEFKHPGTTQLNVPFWDQQV